MAAVALATPQRGRTASTSGLSAFSNTLQQLQENQRQRSIDANRLIDEQRTRGVQQVTRDVLADTSTAEQSIVNQEFNQANVRREQELTDIDEGFNEKLRTMPQYTRAADGSQVETPEYQKAVKTKRDLLDNVNTQFDATVADLNERTVVAFEEGKLATTADAKGFATDIRRNLLDKGLTLEEADKVAKATEEQYEQADLTDREKFVLNLKAKGIESQSKAEIDAASAKLGSVTTGTGAAGRGGSSGYKSRKTGKTVGTINSAIKDMGYEAGEDLTSTGDTPIQIRTMSNNIIKAYLKDGMDESIIALALKNVTEGEAGATFKADPSADPKALELAALEILQDKNAKSLGSGGRGAAGQYSSTTTPVFDPNRNAKIKSSLTAAALNRRELAESVSQPTVEDFQQDVFGGRQTLDQRLAPAPVAPPVAEEPAPVAAPKPKPKRTVLEDKAVDKVITKPIEKTVNEADKLAADITKLEASISGGKLSDQALNAAEKRLAAKQKSLESKRRKRSVLEAVDSTFADRKASVQAAKVKAANVYVDNERMPEKEKRSRLKQLGFEDAIIDDMIR